MEEYEYINYDIVVSSAESWMERPIKVDLRTPTPNGYTASVFYLDYEERDELIRQLGGTLA